MKIKTPLLTFSVCMALCSASFAAEQSAVPAQPMALERVGSITGMDLTTSTIKIDDRPYLVSSQTQILVDHDGVTSSTSSLKEIDLHKAGVSYELDGKGQLKVLVITPANPKRNGGAGNANP